MPSAVELGMKFQISVAGTVSGIGSTRAPGHRRPYGRSCGRAPARSWRPPPSPTKRRAAGRPSTFPPGHDHAGHDLRRLVSHQRAATTCQLRLLHSERHERSADRAGQRQWRLRLRQHQHRFPDQHFNGDELLGRCGIQQSAANTAPTAVADTGNATEKGGIANGSGGSPATGNVLTNDTDPDAGDTKTVTAVSFGAMAGTLGTALAGAHGSLVLNASGTFTYTVNETDAAVQALAAIDQYADRRLQLHHARYGRRHIHDDAHGQHSRRQRRAGACGPDRQPERDRRLGLLSGAARRHLHRRRCRRHASPTRQPPPTARRFPPG